MGPGCPPGMGSCRGSPWGFQERDSPVRETQHNSQGAGQAGDSQRQPQPWTLGTSLGTERQPTGQAQIEQTGRLQIAYQLISFKIFCKVTHTEIHEKCQPLRDVILHFFSLG